MKVTNLTTTYVTPVEIDPFYFKTNRYASLEFHTPGRNRFDYHHKEKYRDRSVEPHANASMSEERGLEQVKNIFNE